ncbi:unnamed protein product [Lampetra planeri]
MHRFIAAANNMDETIMVPSLLRDMPLEEQAASRVETNNNDNESPCPNKQQRDMYEHYLLLKSIKERHGVGSAEEGDEQRRQLP